MAAYGGVGGWGLRRHPLICPEWFLKRFDLPDPTNGEQSSIFSDSIAENHPSGSLLLGPAEGFLHEWGGKSGFC